MTNKTTVCSSVEASVRGAYHPDRYFIEMNVDPANNAATYAHEYWHYLQNISTLHGIKSFLVTQQLLARFSRTMRRDGTSEGDAKFTSAELDDLRFWSTWRSRYEGERGPREDVSSTVVGVAGKVVTFEVLFLARPKKKDVTLTLGAHAIKESIAHVVHRQVARLIGEPQPHAPEFPYSVLERIAAYLVPEAQLDPMVIAGVGTIALLSRDPGLAVEPLLKDVSEAMRRGEPPSEALVHAAQRLVFPYFQDAARIVIDDDLPDIVRIHRGRVASEKAVDYLCEQKKRGLQRRLEDPIFDIRGFFEPDPDSQVRNLVSLMRDAFVPCGMSFDGKVFSFHPPAGREAELRSSSVPARVPGAAGIHDDARSGRSNPRVRRRELQLPLLLEMHSPGSHYPRRELSSGAVAELLRVRHSVLVHARGRRHRWNR